MKTKGGLDTLYSWKSSLETHDEVFLKKLQNEGGLFTPLFLADAKIKLLTPLIELLVKKYDHELDVFKVKGKSLSITLEDILYLTHLPIDGKPVLCKESPSEVASEQVFDDKKAMKIQDLKSIAFDKENDERQRKVAVLKMIIGCFIMPGYNGYEVSSTYVDFLKDLDEVPKYAWGAALLAFLVHGLRGCHRLQENKPQKEGIDANFWIVLAFFFVRIPKLWDIMGITTSQRRDAQPLLSWVLKNLQNKCNDNRGSYVKAVEAFLDEDDVTNENIIWRPYLGCELPSALQSQSDSQRFLRLGPIFNNNYVVHHRPDRVKAQFGILDDDSTWIKEFEYEIEYKDNRGPFKRKYEAIYEKELLLYKKNIMFGSGPSSGSKTNNVEEEDDEISFMPYTINGKLLCQRINPDEAVAHGAGFLAAKLSGVGDEAVQGLELIDVTPLSLGVGVKGHSMSVLIPKNTPIPTKKEGKFHTAYDDLTVVNFRVYQGERLKSRENHLLGKLTLSGLPSAPRGEVEMNVCFEIDADGILHVSARELTTGSNNAIKITGNGSLSKMEIEKMIKDAEQYKLEDEAHMEKVMAHQAVVKYACKLRAKIKSYQVRSGLVKIGLSPKDLKDIEHQIEETIEWLDENYYADTDELKNKELELDNICRRSKSYLSK